MSTSIDIARRMWEEGYQLQVAGEVDEAIRMYQASLNFYPTAEAHTYLGWAFSTKGRFEDAIEQCKFAIQVDPSFGNPYNDIGSYLITLNRHEEAVEWIKRAIKAPRYEARALPFMNLARIYLKTNQYWLALRAFRKAFEIDPSYLPAVSAYQELVARMN